MTRLQAKSLNIGDVIDHRGKSGKFRKAQIIDADNGR